MSDEKDARAAEGVGVATAAENAKLEHSEGGSTTRDDTNDVGVPMLPGSPDEPVGPEDALGEGPTRGDYRDRIGPLGYNPTQTKVNPDFDPSKPADPKKNPPTLLVNQRANAEEIGDVAGKKGGVETSAGEKTS
jgi:hypothetical protein